MDIQIVSYLTLILTGIGTSVGIISILISLSKENKDFHGRLCQLEEKYIQMMERFLDSKK